MRYPNWNCTICCHRVAFADVRASYEWLFDRLICNRNSRMHLKSVIVNSVSWFEKLCKLLPYASKFALIKFEAFVHSQCSFTTTSSAHRRSPPIQIACSVLVGSPQARNARRRYVNRHYYEPICHYYNYLTFLALLNIEKVCIWWQSLHMRIRLYMWHCFPFYRNMYKQLIEHNNY